jgi:hypothetical protein
LLVGFCRRSNNSFVSAASYNDHGRRFRPESTIAKMKLAYLIIPFSVHRPLLAAELTLWNSQQKLLPVAVIDYSPASTLKKLEVIRRMLIIQQQRVADLFPRCFIRLKTDERSGTTPKQRKNSMSRYPECVLADCVFCPRGKDLSVIYSDVDLVCSDARMAFGLSCRH